MANNNLEKLKDFFLKEVDEEDYEENLQKISEWEQELRDGETFEEWQKDDTTQEIISQAIKSYKEQAVQLMVNRKLTDSERQSLFARQDACIWLLSLVYKDVKSKVRGINNEIEKTLKVVEG